MKKLFAKLNQQGDTIVEVLICLAVLGLVLGSATVVVNNNRKTILGTQERSVALKLVQGQIEKTRTATALNPVLLQSTGSVVRAAAGYCIGSTLAPVVASNAACTVNRAGTPTTEVPSYQLRTTVEASQGGYLLRSTAEWDMPNGVRGNVVLVQRIYL